MSADASTIRRFEERNEENNALIQELEDQLVGILPEGVIAPAMAVFYAVRYALDLELILALRNSAGYLMAAKVVNENRIKQILLAAIGDSIENIQKYRTEDLDTVLLERAKNSKSKIVLLKEARD